MYEQRRVKKIMSRSVQTCKIARGMNGCGRDLAGPARISVRT